MANIDNILVMILGKFASTLLLCTLACTATDAQVVAFPGAEGFGRFAVGGRGGRVIEVTNLNDSGPGSFRDACEADGPRTVVFRLSGTIDLLDTVTIVHPYITIAGQTAPGDGICLKRNALVVATHNVIIRYLRSRPGDLLGAQVDAFSVGKESHDVIIDHCSATWSVDECLSASGAVRDITIQWCLIGEALNRSVHVKGEHGYGSLVRAIGGVTLHHNLWLKNDSRNPRLGDNYGRPPWPVFDVRNNVMYDWGSTCSGMTGDRLSANYVSNYLRPGRSSSKHPPIVLTDSARVTYFVQGNVVEGREEQTRTPLGHFRAPNVQDQVTISEVPVTKSTVATTSAEVAYREVLARVGAILPKRDAVDARLVEEVLMGKGEIIDSQEAVGGWPELRSAAPPVDSDHDGMPDDWELANKLNPNDPKDRNDLGAGGYTQLEIYLNNLTAAK